MLLPFSLSLIVLIFAVWQEILLESKKKQLKDALNYVRLNKISQKCLPELSPVKVSKKYRIKNYSPNLIKKSGCFPR